jgi:hypothetical protein
MDNINSRGIPTSLFLNGPKLGIVTDPQSQTGVIGVATFTGIATASFPNPTDGVNDGSIEINWYFDGSRILDTSEDSTLLMIIIKKYILLLTIFHQHTLNQMDRHLQQELQDQLVMHLMNHYNLELEQ